MKTLIPFLVLFLSATALADPPDPCTNPGNETWTVFRYATAVSDDQGGWDYTGWAKNAPDGQFAVNADVDPWEVLTASGWDFCDPPGTEMITEVKLHVFSQQSFPYGPAAMVLSAAGQNHVIVEHPDLDWDTVNITTDQALWTWGLVNSVTAWFGPFLEPGAPKLGAMVDGFKLEVTFSACGEFDVPVCWENDVWMENSCGQLGEMAQGCADENPCTVDGCADALCYNTPVGSCCLDDAECDDGNQCTDDVCTNNTCQFFVHEGACDDDNLCTNGDTCVNTTCTPGPPLLCDDGNLCTDDTCDPVEGCILTFNLAPCDDGNECTAGDHCEEGVCASGQYVPGGECGCMNDEHCPDDMNLCNGIPACIDAVCQTPSETVVLCDDEVPTDCLEPVCNPANGLCQNVSAQENSPCSDQSGCHTGVCQTGVCSLTDYAECATNEDCADDDNPCNGAPMCDGCVCVTDPETLPDCDDDNPCTADFCDQVSGDCLHEWAEGCCVTDDDCDGGTCVAGACMDDCGEITSDGLCDGDVLFWCANGELEQEDCAATKLECLLDEETGAFACLEGECSCFERDCGDDGCGGTCGACAEGEICTDAGLCVEEGSCIPDCTDQECGDDGCDGSCGACGDGETCDGGLCVEEACVPTCDGKTCGDDGCGGVCGECGDQRYCTLDGFCACTGDALWDEGTQTCETFSESTSGCGATPTPRTTWPWLFGMLLMIMILWRSNGESARERYRRTNR